MYQYGLIKGDTTPHYELIPFCSAINNIDMGFVILSLLSSGRWMVEPDLTIHKTDLLLIHRHTSC